MSTIVKTLRGTRYPVTGIKLDGSGRVLLVARQPSGKARYLTKSDVPSSCWYGALAHLTRRTR
jgi:hypothetical protein